MTTAGTCRVGGAGRFHPRRAPTIIRLDDVRSRRLRHGVEMLRTSTAGEVQKAISELVPEIAARAIEIEQRGCIPVDLFDALVATGCFGAHLPAAHGGLELSVEE